MDETSAPGAAGAKPAFGKPDARDTTDEEDATPPTASGRFARKDARKGAISDK
jgi:hypothetical protein